jgi:hypothetical protein
MLVNDGLGEVLQGAAVDCFEAVHRNFIVTEADWGSVCSDRFFNPLLSIILIKTVNLWSVTIDLVLAGYY